MRRQSPNFFAKYKRNIFSIAFLLVLGVVTFAASVNIYSNMVKKEVPNAQEENASYEAQSIKETTSINSKTIEEKESEALAEKVRMQDEELKKAKAEAEKAAQARKVAKVEEAKKAEVKKDPTFVAPIFGSALREYAKDDLVYSETLDEWITHTALDISCEKGATVRASADGKIKSVKTDPRYGLTVTIEHTNGFKSVYANLDSTECKEGETIKQGQVIGLAGNTASFESLDKPHLHFEILKGEESLNPNEYIKLTEK